jgi:hypothetical protein
VRGKQPIEGPTRLQGLVNGQVSGKGATSSGTPSASEPSRWLSMWRAVIAFWFISLAKSALDL